jgi:hypothetical protein
MFTVPDHRDKQASPNTEYRGHKKAVFGTRPPVGRLLSLNLLQIFNNTFIFLDNLEKFAANCMERRHEYVEN